MALFKKNNNPEKKKEKTLSVNLKHNKLSAVIALVLVAVVVVCLYFKFSQMWVDDTFYPGPGVTSTIQLSEYNPNLAGTYGDTTIYVLDSGVEGGSILVMGGTHANEPSGVLAATYLVENCTPKQGVLYVITETNKTGFTCTDPQEASPMFYTVEDGEASRTFRFGSRAGNVIFQWPDPDIYQRNAADRQKLSGSETRNLNRTYPGVANGTVTEQISYAITEFIKAKDIDITVDLHEASPEYMTINAIVFHEDAEALAAEAKLWLEDDVPISIETSAKNLHGLTHRELGDYTDTLAILMETANPSQGRLHGATGSQLVVTGKDNCYYRAAQYDETKGDYKRLWISYGEDGIPVSTRAARHLSYIVEFTNDYANVCDGALPIDLGLGEGWEVYYDISSNLYSYLVAAANR